MVYLIFLGLGLLYLLDSYNLKKYNFCEKNIVYLSFFISVFIIFLSLFSYYRPHVIHIYKYIVIIVFLISIMAYIKFSIIKKRLA